MFQKILTEDEIGRIHQTSMALLANVGVEFPCQEALAVFREHGIRTDGSRVYLGEDQLHHPRS
jgi:trimethylamine--corrinoid protein Co-methyltransferase